MTMTPGWGIPGNAPPPDFGAGGMVGTVPPVVPGVTVGTIRPANLPAPRPAPFQTRPGWSVAATTLNGDGTETLLSARVPFRDFRYTSRLTGVGEFSGTITPEHPGTPAIRPWSTALYVIGDGQIRGGFIVSNVTAGDQMTVTAVSFTGYATGMPYTHSATKLYGVDCSWVIRAIWAYLQLQPGGNIGLMVADSPSLVLVGHLRTTYDEQGQPEQHDEPHILSPWDTTDLGARLDELAATGDLDWVESHYWTDDGQIAHTLRVAPSATVGGVRDDLRFRAGENVIPTGVEDPPQRAVTEVVVTGAGQDWSTVVGHAIAQSRPGLRRVESVDDDAIATVDMADLRAVRELTARTQQAPLPRSLRVRADHPHAPLGSYGPGDRVRVTGRFGQASVDTLARVLAVTVDPSSPTVEVEVAPVGGVVPGGQLPGGSMIGASPPPPGGGRVPGSGLGVPGFGLG